MSSKTLRNTKRIAVSALLAAISFVALYLGALTGVFDLCAVVVGALCVTFAKIEMGGWYPHLIGAVTFVLSFLLLTDKMVAFEFLFLGGIYPILKSYAENLGRRAGKWAAWTVKMVYFNAALALFIIFAKFVFTAGNEDLFAGSAGMLIAAVVFTNAFFIFYDYAMTRFISYYLFVLRKKLKIRTL